jgi:hypothetical protein
MPGDELDEEESLWARRLEESYQRALSDEDQRGMQAAAKAGLSHIRSRKAEKAKAAKTASDAASGVDDGKISIDSFDGLLAMFNQIPATPVDAAKLREALQRARAINRPDMVQIFFRALENSAFAADLARYCALWEPAQKGTDDAVIQTETASAPN